MDEEFDPFQTLKSRFTLQNHSCTEIRKKFDQLMVEYKQKRIAIQHTILNSEEKRKKLFSDLDQQYRKKLLDLEIILHEEECRECADLNDLDSTNHKKI